MERIERFYKMEAMVQGGRTVTSQQFLETLEVSISTLKRDIVYLRDRMNVPIEWDAMAGGYRLLLQPGAPSYTLPGMWFNAEEAHALLTMQNLLGDLGSGLLGGHVQGLMNRIRQLMEDQTGEPADIAKRVRVRKAAARKSRSDCFPVVASAVLKRKRLQIKHHNRSAGLVTEREVSPQRLNHYKDNWYLDAWCHLRNDLRSFGLDAIESAAILNVKAKEMPPKEVAKQLDASYGIFSSGELQWAELSFSHDRARWVSHEVWHEQQESWTGEDGRYHLRLPFSEPTELAMDILRHLPEVRVVSPESLKRQVNEAVLKFLEAQG